MCKMLRPITTLHLSHGRLSELQKQGLSFVEDTLNNKELYEKCGGEERYLPKLPSTMSAWDKLQEESDNDILSSSNKMIDSILNGGFHCGSITEIYGETSSGKTQICMQVCIQVQLSKEHNGLNGKAIYIDTRHNFSAMRLQDLTNNCKMGIPGLTTYIHQRSVIYLRPYQLHDTFLVIDGNSICCQIYKTNSKCNCTFGGDYDRYVQAVSDFFDSLLKCNITPLVIIDGAIEDKKMKTVLQRTRDKIQTVASYSSVLQNRSQCFPFLIKQVFKEVIVQKRIKFAMSTFEADNDIASIASILQCPVLSYDSDFFIYDIMYIPFSTLDLNICKIHGCERYMMQCKMYKVEYLLNRFKGFDRSVLPLIATLLGNDYVKKSTFRKFFRSLKLPKATKRKWNEEQRRIEATFNWLREHTLDTAITCILSRLPQNIRQSILRIIEMVVNSYAVLSSAMLIPLGFSSEYISQLTVTKHEVPYKYQKTINELTCNSSEEESDKSSEEIDDDGEMSHEEEIKPNFRANYSIFKVIPQWFINEFNMGKFPSYFLEILTRRLIILPIQIENNAYASASLVSLRIIQVIYKILRKGVFEHNKQLHYFVRNKNNLMRCMLDNQTEILNCDIPSLFQLRELPFDTRKMIIDRALDVSSSSTLNEFPDYWQLYIACMIYWLRQKEEPRKTICHMYALLFTMLFDVIDSKIGYYRSLHSFQNRYGHIIKSHSSTTGGSNSQKQLPTNVPLRNAIREVTSVDCMLAANFFISNFDMDKSLLSNPKKFNVTIVHSFSQFQSCLGYAIHLNELLDYPYKAPKISKLYNGTFLYNLYSNFMGRNNIDQYITVVLINSPTLLQLFLSLVTNVKTLSESSEWKMLECKVNKQKKRKRNNKTKNKLQTTEDKDEDESSDENLPSEIGYDHNNPFCVLSLSSS